MTKQERIELGTSLLIKSNMLEKMSNDIRAEGLRILGEDKWIENQEYIDSVNAVLYSMAQLPENREPEEPEGLSASEFDRLN
jgi:hypothetical protein